MIILSISLATVFDFGIDISRFKGELLNKKTLNINGLVGGTKIFMVAYSCGL